MPNVLGFILGVIQITLYQYYKHKSKVISIPEIKLPEHIINIKASNSVVYPVDSSRSSGSEVEVEEEKEHKTAEVGDGEVEQHKGALMVTAMVDDDPCGVEVLVNVKPIIIMCAA